MGFTNATEFLQGVGYGQNEGERPKDYLERAANAAVQAGLGAEIAARALSSLLIEAKITPEVELLEQTLGVLIPVIEDAPLIQPQSEAHAVEAVATVVTAKVTARPAATLRDLERVLLRDDSSDALRIVRGGDEEEDALSWQEFSLCAQTDPEAFFPEKGGSTAQAKRVCAGCEVRAECLEYALANNERFGIWGGLSERQRRKLSKKADVA